jgi:hypothetical protein
MSKDKDSRYSINFPHKERKRAERIAALLRLSDWPHAFGIGLHLAEKHAEASVIGRTEMLACTPKLAEIIENNREFIAALCEEGVVEWLTPFVLAKSKQSNQLTPDTTQP